MSLPPSEIPQGAIRFNTDSQRLEFYAQGEWWVMSTDTPNLGHAGTPTLIYSSMLAAVSALKTPEGGFRGVANYSSAGDRSEGTGGLTFTPVPPISFSSSVRIYDNNNVTKGRVNSNSYVQHTTNGFVTLVSGSGTINTIDVVRTDNSGYDAGFVAIEVDGVLLTDGAAGIPAQPTPGPRGVFPGGRSASASMTDDMDYINISSTGDAINFGDLLTDSFEAGACSSSTRGVKFGGRVFPSGAYQDNLEAYTFASTGSIADIEDLRTATVYSCGASNETRGLIMGGILSSSYGGAYSGGWNNIDYITIASFGESIEFGDLSFDHPGGMNQANSPTRGIFAGGFAPHNGAPGAPSQPALTTTKIQFVTIPTLGNSQSFGDLSGLTSYTSGAGNSVRGIYAGNGATPKTDIEVINISSGGNGVKFGDLTTSKFGMAAVSSPTRVVLGGGSNSYSTDIEYVNIATEGDAVDFGNLTSGRAYQSGCSNAHGGL